MGTKGTRVIAHACLINKSACLTAVHDISHLQKTHILLQPTFTFRKWTYAFTHACDINKCACLTAPDFFGCLYLQQIV